MSCATLKNEFRLRNVRLNHHNDRAFYCCQWRIPHTVFVVLRLTLAGYAIFSLTHLFARPHGDFHLMVAFTVWSYIVLTAHLVWAALLSLVYFKQGQAGIVDAEEFPNQTSGLTDSQRVHSRGFTNNAFTGSASHVNSEDLLSSNDTSTTTWDLKISWLLSNIISDAAPVVTIVFFTALYPNIQPHPSVLDLEDTNVHALNFVFVIIDHLISARPVRLLHAVFPFTYGLGYITFSIIYWSTDHVNHVVYPILDWNYPGIATATTVGLCCVAIPLLHLFYFGLYRLKYHIFKSIYGYDL